MAMILSILLFPYWCRGANTPRMFPHYIIEKTAAACKRVADFLQKIYRFAAFWNPKAFF
jgi:hypothetical protein